ncbi:uncharacterized protein J4E88_007254 [Alternaria novae-zelandiae]|uniref:uncharacterized protein n=1 Tax=Alternaria novae-zelandiae TaxID=430562 RepID=UPI0020C1D6D0|nr:uncharacterized protein J4E88_007254 [Alternaria novae-zelandiae]KAI4676340.1 hypothetical protein J4E88_007254 [Alternaria novae-zelandiae]
MATPFLPQPGSPLLRLPGELRNKIHRNVFKQEGHILLVPSYVGPAPVMVCAIPDIELLSTCRQFYDEARSILFSDNTFMLSTQMDAFVDASTLGLLSSWVTGLGSNLDYVRKVVIDLEPLCPGLCQPTHDRIDLKPIMVMIWRYQDILTSQGNRQRAKIEVSFAFSGRHLRSHTHWGIPTPYPINESNLNAMITLLTPQRSPEMSPYLRAARSLHSIQATPDGLQATFILRRSSHQRRDDAALPIIPYDVDSNGRLKRMQFLPNRMLRLANLLYSTSIKQNLLGMLMESNDHHCLTYNIESRTISRRLPELFSMNGQFRRIALKQWQHIHVIGKMTSRSAQASFDDFASMQAWCAASGLFFPDKWDERPDIPPTLKMRFELPEREDFSCLRISITNIIMATLELPVNSRLWVEQFNGGLPLQAKTGMLYRLQRQMFVFLADVLHSHPDRGNEACPDVIMDGKCIIRDIEYERDDGSKFTINYERADENLEEMEEDIEDWISHFIEQEEMDIAAYVPTITFRDDEEFFGNVEKFRYDLSAPYHPSLRGVITKLACFLQGADTTGEYWD